MTLEIPEAKALQVLTKSVPDQGGAVYLEPPSHAVGRAQQILFDYDLYRVHKCGAYSTVERNGKGSNCGQLRHL